MHIINAMFSRNWGGIEQCFVDYTQGLMEQGNKVTTLIYPGAKVRTPLLELGVDVLEIKNLCYWDWHASSVIKRLIKRLEPDIMIAHGNRATMLLKPSQCLAPLVGVTHNYNLKHLIGLDGIIALTEDLRNTVIRLGQPAEQIFKAPNMIRYAPEQTAEKQPNHNPPVIGTMGRFVAKKGFDIFLDALAILKKQGVDFKAIIGGSGELKKKLQQQSKTLGLEQIVTFDGWVEEKTAFFDKLDIFCLPSHHEPFGIILLEAFMHNKPVVTTASEGPKEIATHEHDALITPLAHAEAMAQSLKQLLKNSSLQKALTENAKQTLKQYAMPAVSKRLCSIFDIIIGRNQAKLRVAHAMFSSQKGGMEQSYLDYTKALLHEGNDVIALVPKGFKYRKELAEMHVPIYDFSPINQYDIRTMLTIRKLLINQRRDIVLAHGNRAITLCKYASKNKIPVIGVNHSENVKRSVGLDGAITVSEHIRQSLIKIGHPENDAYVLPNMIAIPDDTYFSKRNWHTPPIIGTMGRFEHSKAFDILIDAVAILKNKGVNFVLRIGGDGLLDIPLKARVEKQGLESHIEFTGWVDDKAHFFKSIDLFCLPSRHETFGIVILESFLYGIPVVATNCPGPASIIKHETNGMMVERENATALATALENALISQHKMQNFAKKAFEDVRATYNITQLSSQLQHILESTQKQHGK